MKVMKFGGSSVGSPDSMLLVKNIIGNAAAKDDVVVVVSALSGVTDQLIMTAKLASNGDLNYISDLEGVITRHKEQIKEVVLPHNREQVGGSVGLMLEELENILKGVMLIRDLSHKTLDTIVSYGERLSSVIVAGAIDGSVLFDARELIKTKHYFSKHQVVMEATSREIIKQFSPLPHISILGGFISSDLVSGDVTNLGRGGSDYTAAIIAATLNASILEIWTDVDGFMTADPKVISSAYVIEKLSFVEATELSNFGAKVIYPPTIFPVYHKNIPIKIKNTFNCEAPGTSISRENDILSKKLIRGISSVSDTCLITIQGLGMVGVIGVNYRIFKVLSEASISVFFVSQAASENNISIGVQHSDADMAVEVLDRELASEIAIGEISNAILQRNLATVAIVGENMKPKPGIAGKLFGTLGNSGINVIAIAQGASQTNISFVIAAESLRKAINVIHDSFFLSDYQVLNIFIAGVGLVGHSLLEQIRMQQRKLMDDNSLQIRVVGICNSTKFIMDRNGIDLAGYKQELVASQNSCTPQIFRDEMMKINIFNSVFVDCTASEAVAEIYKDVLEHNISVVAANKVAASSSYDHYSQLKQIARERGVKYLYETNVGAGLPIINTISDLMKSGDKILKIEAVVSGTLNFIFNEMNADIPLSRAIRMAKEAGYAEPDPRIDLSGVDVVRKLVILGREAGYALEQADVKKDLFIPSKYFNGSIEEFWNTITELDGEFEERRKRLEANGKRWRFVAVLDNGQASVALREVDSSSPFYELAGSNNVISLTTERYKEYPMQIKGYGAGANVTAAGVFADIISIANIR